MQILISNSLVSLLAVEAPLLVEDSITPMGIILPNHTDWSLEFDKQVCYFRLKCFMWLYLELVVIAHKGSRTGGATAPPILAVEGLSPSNLTLKEPTVLTK